LFNPTPLPIVTESGSIDLLDPIELIRASFPSNVLSVISDTRWFLPIALFALFFGLALGHDPVMARPIIPVLDVISRRCI